MWIVKSYNVALNLDHIRFNYRYSFGGYNQEQKNRHGKTHEIFYGIVIAIMSFILLSTVVYHFGYQVGSDKAKRDNRNDGVITEPVQTD